MKRSGSVWSERKAVRRTAAHLARATQAFCPKGGLSAFTLLEVLIACGIFFTMAFAVLTLVTQGLGAARALQQREPDIGILAAAYSLTNTVEEGVESGDFEQIAPGLYPGYSWSCDRYEVGSNGLYRIDFILYHKEGRKGGVTETHLSVFKWSPGSPASRFGGGRGGLR